MLGGAKNIVCNIKQCFFDIIFPKYCLACGKEGNYWCADCQLKEILVWGGNCFNCRQEKADLNLCTKCQDLYYFSGLLCATNYEDKIISSLIQACKYSFVKELTNPLGLLMANYLQQELTNSKNIFFQDFFKTTVMAVPLSQKRQSWRGFNQAEIIAKVVADYFNLPINSNLKRVLHKKPQAKLTAKNRLTNMSGSFHFSGPAPEKIILIDDVITTGSTVNECAKVLRAAGAEEILVLAVAKG